MNSAIQASTLAACELGATEDWWEVMLFLLAGMWLVMKISEWKPNNDNVQFYDQALCTDHFSWPRGLGLNKGVLSGSYYQVMLVSPDPVDLRCIGSRLYLPASISAVSITDPSAPFLVNHYSPFWNIPHHNPQSLHDHISRHGQVALTIITIHSRYF